MRGLAGIVAALLTTAACAPLSRPLDRGPTYGGATASFMSDEILSVSLQMGRRDSDREVRAYADCAAAEAMALRNVGFARHVRTLTWEEGGALRADAVYSVTTERPAGDFVLVAAETLLRCRAEGIPGV